MPYKITVYEPAASIVIVDDDNSVDEQRQVLVPATPLDTQIESIDPDDDDDDDDDDDIIISETPREQQQQHKYIKSSFSI